MASHQCRVGLSLMFLLCSASAFISAEEPSSGQAKAGGAPHLQAGEDHKGNASQNEKVASNYQEQLNRLKDLAAGSIDPCTHAIYTAARDSRVRALALRN